MNRAIDWVSGNIFIRPRDLQAGETVAGHCHNFDHTHFTLAGWILVRGWVHGAEVVVQKCAPEYRRTRALRLRYEPETILRPVRLPDRLIEGQKAFNIGFIRPGEAVPEGGSEIAFNPSGYSVLIHAGTPHDTVALDLSYGVCIYSHREPQGDISLSHTGWDEAYV